MSPARLARTGQSALLHLGARSYRISSAARGDDGRRDWLTRERSGDFGKGCERVGVQVSHCWPALLRCYLFVVVLVEADSADSQKSVKRGWRRWWLDF